MNKFIKWIKSSSSDRFFLVLVIILLNLVSIRTFFRFDLTSQKTYSLSQASKTAVKNIDFPLSIKVFFSSNLPSPYNNIVQYLNDLLAEYKANASKNFSYQNYDMSKDENQQIAYDFGLSPVQVDTVETTGFSSKIAWMGIAITYGDYIAVVDALKTTSDLEYKITTTIAKIIAAQDNNSNSIFEIGYITGHGENELRTNQYAQSMLETGSGNFRNLLSDIYSIKEINLSQQDIPKDLNAIIINGPKTEIPQHELEKIDHFIINGGNAAFFVDSLDEYFANENDFPVYIPNESGINKLLERYGTKIENYYVMDEKCFTENQTGYGKLIYNWVPVVSKDGVAKKNPITQNLGEILFFCNGPIDITSAKNNSDLTTTVLAKSSKNSWRTDENIILYPGQNLPTQNQEFKSENLAVLLEGKFNSAFNQNEKSKHNSRVIVVSSGASTTDILIDNEGNSATSMFIRNIIDYVNNHEEFCTMRTKGTRLDFISINNERFAFLIQLLNEFGLAIVVLIIGFIVWRMRIARKYLIHQKYNSDDTRFVTKNKKGSEKWA